MQIKVKFFNRNLIKDYCSVLSIISVIFSFALIVINIPNEYKKNIGLFLLFFLLAIYLILWLRANTLNGVELKINNSIVDVKIGNIFEENEFKVIAFNEYFDTQVDNKIISEKTLNGIYI